MAKQRYQPSLCNVIHFFQIHRGVFKAHLEPSELVKELTAKNFESQLKIVPVELGGNAVLPCRMDANLVGTVYKSDPVLFYFFTPQSEKRVKEY